MAESYSRGAAAVVAVELLAKRHLPETCSNLVCGGGRRNWLSVTASTPV